MRIAENCSVLIDPPVDINGGAVTTPYVNMEQGKDLSIVISTGAIAASASAAVTLSQATDNAGTSAKALTYTDHYAATSSVDVPAAQGSTLTIGDTDDNKVFIIEVDASQLDVSNGFTHVACAIADPGQSTILGTNLVLTFKRAVDASAL